MHAHDRADIASQIAAACCDGKVLVGVQSVCVDHEVTVIAVHGGSLAAVASVEELGESLALAMIDVAHIEPGCIAWNDGRKRLRDQVRPRFGLQIGLCLGFWIRGCVFILFRVVHTTHLFVVLSIGIFCLWSRRIRSIEGIIGGHSRCGR